MGMDITTLGVKVESKGIDQATTSLDNLGAQAERTEKSVTKLSERMAGTSATFQAIKESVNQLKIVMASAFPAGAFGAVNTELKQLADTLKLINQSVPKGNFKIDFKGVGQDAEVARKGVASLNQSLMEGTNIFQVVGKELYTLRNLLGGTMLAAAMVNVTKSSIEMADSWVLANARLKIFLGTAEEASAAQETLYKTAQSLKVPMAGVTTLFTRLVPAMGEYGYSTKSAVEVTTAMAAALKVSGATGAETSSVLLQFSQAMAAGRLNGAEFNAVAEGAPIILRMLSQELGISRGELKKFAADGMLSTATVAEVLKKHLEDLSKSAKDMPLTIGASLDMLSDSFARMIGKMNESTGVAGAVANSIKFIADNLALLGKAVITVVSGIIAYNVAMATSNVVSKSAAVSVSMYTGAVTTTGVASAAAAVAVGLLDAAMAFLAANPVVIAITAITMVVVGLGMAFSKSASQAEEASKKFEEAAKAGDVSGAMKIQQAEVERTGLAYSQMKNELIRLQDEQSKARALGASMSYGEETIKQTTKKVEELASAWEKAKKKLQDYKDEQAQENIKTDISAYNEKLLLLNEEFRLKRKMTETEKELFKFQQFTAKQKSPSPAVKQGNDIKEAYLQNVIFAEKRNKDQLEELKTEKKLEESVAKKYLTQINGAQAYIDKITEELGLGRKLTEAEKEAMKIESFMNANKKGADKDDVAKLEAMRQTILLLGKQKEYQADLDKQLAAISERQHNKNLLDIQANDTTAQAIRASEEQLQTAKLANAGIQESTLMLEMNKRATEAATKATLEKINVEKQTRINEVNLSEHLTPEDKASKVKQLEDEMAANNRLIAQYDQMLGIRKAITAEAFKASQIKLLEVGRSPGQILAEGFGEAGAAIGKMIDTYEEFGKQSKIINNELAAQLKYLSDKGLGDNSEEVIRVKQQAAEKQVQINAGMYANMAGAAKGFFSENSKGYQLLAKTEKAFRVVELALAMKSFVQKMAFTTAETTAVVAGEATKTVAQTASTEAGVALSLTQAAANAQAAVTGAFVGIGPSGFVTGAAMIGIMAGLGFALSGGSGSHVPSSAERQASQGTGTVFGESDSKSESISKALTLLSDNSKIALTYNAGMLSSLKSIEASMTGVAKSVIRGGVQGQVGTAGGMGTTHPSAFNNMGGAGFGIATGYLFAPIKDIGKALFSVKKSVVDSGLIQNAQALSDVMSGGLDVTGYTDIETKKKNFGRTKTSTETNLSALSTELEDQLTKAVTGMADAIKEAAKVLSMDGDSFNATLGAFVVDIGRISIQGMDSKQIQETLTNVFSKMGDEMAKATLPGLEKFQNVGEGYLETLTRVASSVATVDGIFNQIGQTFGTVGIEGIDAKMKLIELAGGLQELSNKVGNFYDKFYSDSEKQAQTLSLVTSQFKKLGIEMIDLNADDARIKFREIVNHYKDTDTEVYNSLLNMVDAVDSLAPAFNEAADKATILKKTLELENRIKELTLSKTEYLNYARELELEALAKIDASLPALQKRIYLLEDEKTALEAMKSATQSAFSVLEKSVNNQKKVLKTDLDDKVKNINELKKRENEKYEAERDRLMQQQQLAEASWESQKQAQVSGLNTMLDAAQATIDNIKGLFDDLTTSIEKLRSSSAVYNKQSYSAAQSQLDSALMLAKTAGVLPDSEKFKGVLDTLTSLDNSSFSSSFDFERQQLQTAGKLSQLQGIAGSKMSTAEATVIAIENNIKAVEAQSSAASSYYSSMLSDLDTKHQEQMKKYDDEVAQLNLQYETDIEYLDAVLQNAKDQLDIANGTYVEIKDVNTALQEFNAFGIAYLNSMAQKEAVWLQIGKTTEMIGSVEIPSLKVKDELIAEELRQLREAQAAQNRAIAENTQKTAKILSRWDGDGQPETRVV